jgi:multidrug efflux pump subunit AcrB
VFVPVAFMTGIVGQFFRQFGLTIAVAVMLSLFVAFTLDGTMLRLFRNGQQVAAAPCVGLTQNAPSALGIGAKLGDDLEPVDNNAGFWDGRLDEISVFHRALTPAQLRALYEAAR